MSEQTSLWTLDQVLAATGGQGTVPFAATGVQFDSRQVMPGDLFLAMPGARDGHEFVADAMKKGAVAAIVSEGQGHGPEVLVEDVPRALEALGVAARRRAQTRIAVTGSVGKTTVTQILLAALGRAGSAHGPVKSFNNHIGVPLTLARTPHDTQAAVYELGMNAPGEIAPLSKWVAPQVALITKVAAVHIEAFEDITGIAREKASIAEGLQTGGMLCTPAGTPFETIFQQAAERAGAKRLTFGPDGDAECLSCRVDGQRQHLSVRVGGETVEVTLQTLGAHWAENAAGILLTVQAAGIDLGHGVAALEAYRPPLGRGGRERVQIKGGTLELIDDSYNANPTSVRAALSVLAAASGRKVAILTDMLELGDHAAAAHRDLDEAVKAAGVELLIVVGPLMKGLADQVGNSLSVIWASTPEDATATVHDALRPGDVVLVKGSNASGAARLAEGVRALSSQNSVTELERR